MNRALLAGLAFGVALTAGLTAVTAWQLGGICLPEVAENAVLAIAGGVLGLGPVAAYGRRGNRTRRPVRNAQLT